MTVTTAKTGFGTTFSRETVTPATYAAMGELVDVTPPSLTRDTVDATHHGSTNRVREFIAGLRDSGEAEIVLNYDPASAAFDDLKTDYDADAPHNYKITFPDTETVIFPALITEIAATTPLNDKMTLRAKFKVTGAPTWS